MDSEVKYIYNKIMSFDWDDTKRRANLRLHALDFVDAQQVLEGDVVIIKDERRDYGEDRMIAYGRLCGRVTVVVYTMRGMATRIISFRKAI